MVLSVSLKFSSQTILPVSPVPWSLLQWSMSQSCSPELETLTIRCRLFYVPREFASFILIAVYIPPQAGAMAASQKLSTHIMAIENSHPDSIVLVLGDFNHVSLRRALQRFREHIFTATRGEKILNQCFCVIPRVFHTARRAPLRESDHNTVFLIPKYRQRLKAIKPCGRTVRQWFPTDCFATTDWTVMKEPNDSLDPFTDSVTSLNLLKMYVFHPCL